ELASGLEGEGRMAEPEEIIAFVEEDMNIRSPLKGKKILINAGPTHEAIDPVRFIGNHSSGKMGVALAEQASALGAQVFLVLGPGSARPGDSTIEVHDVVSADEMNEACQEIFTNMDIAILSAAVADYKPAKKADQKIKKSGDNLEILLVENPDILRGLGERKSDGQVLVGFALETQNAVPNAIQKLHKKNCDLIVLNTPSEKGSGFGYDTNEVILIGRDEKTHTLELKSKSEIAKEILDHICNHLLA
ncbi:MAG TPA: bifunctional phosphopantothenoylcysteine decarboxylase/phosphopantothenate--cysteine ligase CoaBC, partial [Cryomorphaceae bacterium]|nr:bifunctional phosphopantothenoylcysteine decarboxylase/phosphopantothenate--cysteine ligase CoaBC [Cryomorphaceae bacterium]